MATGYTGTVAFASSDSQAGLPANYTFVAADDGTHTFSATLKTAGTQYIKATDTMTSSITGTQSGIVVQPAGAASLTVTGFPTPDTAGVADNFTVTAYDPYGNIATGYTGTVQFTSADSQAVLPANYTFVATDDGTHTFSATLKTAGTQYITATDTLNVEHHGHRVRHRRPARLRAQSLTVSGFPTPTRQASADVTSPSPHTILTATSPPATPARQRSPAATRQAAPARPTTRSHRQPMTGTPHLLGHAQDRRHPVDHGHRHQQRSSHHGHRVGHHRPAGLRPRR